MHTGKEGGRTVYSVQYAHVRGGVPWYAGNEGVGLGILWGDQQ